MKNFRDNIKSWNFKDSDFIGRGKEFENEFPGN